MLEIYVSCVVPRFYDAENGVCLNCPFADSCDEQSTKQTIHRKSEGDNKSERKR